MKAWSISSSDAASSLRSREFKASLKNKAARASEASVRGLTYAWSRFTHNRHTTLYFLSSLIFCILIFLFQLGAWNTNKAAADIASALLTQANLSTTNFAAYDRTGVLAGGRGFNTGVLRICEDIEGSRDPPAKCRIAWPVTSSAGSEATPVISSTSIIPTATPPAMPPGSGPVLPPGVTLTSGTGRMPIPTDVTFAPINVIPVGVYDASRKGAQSHLGHHQHHQHGQQHHRNKRLQKRYLPHPDWSTLLRAAPVPTPTPAPQHLVRDPESNSDHRLERRTILIERLPTGRLRVQGLRTNSMIAATDPVHQKDVLEVPTVCVQSVKWALQVLHFAGSEDIASVFFQIWVLSMAIVALVHESVPYLLAALLTQLVSAIWSIASLAETVNFRGDFNRLSSASTGACAGVDLLPSYWDQRTNVQIVTLVFNILASGVSLWLTYRLNSQFSWSVFKRIGASVIINKLYKLVLTLSILIQLTFFFVITSLALWIDQLFRGLFAIKAEQAGLYKGISIIAFLVLLPWLLLGWVSVRRENRLMMLVFLCLSTFYLIVSFALCFSTTFQLTFIYWRFFAAVYVITFLLVLTTLAVGIMCRLNFGRGLPNYLQSEKTPGFGEFRPAPDAPDNDPEKVAFPSRAKLPQLGTIHRPLRTQPSAVASVSSMSSVSSLTHTRSLRTSMSATAGHSSLRSHGTGTAGHAGSLGRGASRHSHIPSSLSSLPRKSIAGDYAPGMGSPIPPPIDTAAAKAGVSTRKQDRSASDRESGRSAGGRRPRPESVMLQRAELEGLTQDVPRPPPAALAPAVVSVPIVPTPGPSASAVGGSASEADQVDNSVVLQLGRKTSNLARAPGIRRFARDRQADAEYAAAIAASTAPTPNNAALVTGSGDLNPFSDGEPTGGEEVDEYDSGSGRHSKMRAAKVKSFHPSVDQPFMSREQMEERMGFGRRPLPNPVQSNKAGTNSTERKMMAAHAELAEMSDDSVGGRLRGTAPAKAFQKKRTQD